MSAFNEPSLIWQSTGAITGQCIASGKAFLDSYEFWPTGVGSGGIWDGTTTGAEAQGLAKAHYAAFATSGHKPAHTFKTPSYCSGGIWVVASGGQVKVEFHR